MGEEIPAGGLRGPHQAYRTGASDLGWALVVVWGEPTVQGACTRPREATTSRTKSEAFDEERGADIGE